MAHKRAKEFLKLHKNVRSFTNGQVTITDQHDDLDWFTMQIYPKNGYYQYGKFDFEVKLHEDYAEAPVVNCLTRLFHPNIDASYTCDDSGNVCINMLDEWDGSAGLEDLVHALLFLFYNPNTSDPLSCTSENWAAAEEHLELLVYRSLMGVLTVNEFVDEEFLVKNFHVPEDEDADDYMYLHSLTEDPFHSVSSEEAEEETVVEVHDEQATSVLTRQHSKLDKVSDVTRSSTLSSLVHRVWNAELSRTVLDEVAGQTLEFLIAVVYS